MRVLTQTLNAVGNVITALALLLGAVPLLIRAIREVRGVRQELHTVGRAIDRVFESRSGQDPDD